MSSLLQQLELNSTLFIQLAVFIVMFLVLSNLYFRPFQRLLEARHKRLVEDREAAEKLLLQADSRFEEYRARLAAERATARSEYDRIMAQAKKEEAEIISRARAEAKQITQQALESAQAQQSEVKKALEKEIETLAQAVVQALLVKKGGV